jgi:hypothetical protein
MGLCMVINLVVNVDREDEEAAEDYAIDYMVEKFKMGDANVLKKMRKDRRGTSFDEVSLR